MQAGYIAILFDFSKGFDTLPTTWLLQKLTSMMFSRSELSWLLSYLWDRKQRVFTNSSNFDRASRNMGVQEGSALGPLLFCLCINDIKNIFTDETGHALYADDFQMYIQVPWTEVRSNISKLSKVAKSALNWAAMSGLRFNPQRHSL